MNISVNSIEDDDFIESLDSVLKVSSDTTNESENETTTKSPVELIEKQLRKRLPITYTEEREMDDIQEQIDMVLGVEEEDEFLLNGEDEEEEDEDDDDLRGYICPGEINDILAEGARILSLEESEKEIGEKVDKDVVGGRKENTNTNDKSVDTNKPSEAEEPVTDKLDTNNPSEVEEPENYELDTNKHSEVEEPETDELNTNKPSDVDEHETDELDTNIPSECEEPETDELDTNKPSDVEEHETDELDTNKTNEVEESETEELNVDENVEEDVVLVNTNTSDQSIDAKKHNEVKESETDETNEFEDSNEYEDPYPEMQKHGFLFKLNGKENPMFIDPLGNHCSSCGKKKSQENWCRHLVSAGYKMSPKIIVKPKRDGTKSLDKLMKFQKSSKSKTG